MPYTGNCSKHGCWEYEITDECPLCLAEQYLALDGHEQRLIDQDMRCKQCKKTFDHDSDLNFTRISVDEQEGGYEDWDTNDHLFHVCHNCYQNNMKWMEYKSDQKYSSEFLEKIKRSIMSTKALLDKLEKEIEGRLDQ